jgi:hypothetical protein
MKLITGQKQGRKETATYVAIYRISQREHLLFAHQKLSIALKWSEIEPLLYQRYLLYVFTSALPRKVWQTSCKTFCTSAKKPN